MIPHNLAFFQEFLRGARSIVVQISFVMLIFLLFSGQILGAQKSLQGPPLPPCGGKPAFKKGHFKKMRFLKKSRFIRKY